METVAKTLYLVVGTLNLIPVSGVSSANRLRALYGIVLEDPSLVILMRHRAVLFGIIGGLLVASAFHKPLRPLAVAVGLTSMLSFVLVALLVGDFNAELRRVIIVDIVASGMLVAAAWMARLNRR